MIETEKKDMFLIKFNKHTLSKEEIESFNVEDVISLFSPSSFSNNVHKTERVLIVDACSPIVIDFFNAFERMHGYSIVSRDNVGKESLTVSPFSGKRYCYHGGSVGEFDGYFTITDRYFRLRKNNSGIIESRDSIPNWNIAHFLCDYIDTDSKARRFAAWVDSNGMTMVSLLNALSASFSAKTKDDVVSK